MYCNGTEGKGGESKGRSNLYEGGGVRCERRKIVFWRERIEEQRKGERSFGRSGMGRAEVSR